MEEQRYSNDQADNAADLHEIQDSLLVRIRNQRNERAREYRRNRSTFARELENERRRILRRNQSLEQKAAARECHNKKQRELRRNEPLEKKALRNWERRIQRNNGAQNVTFEQVWDMVKKGRIIRRPRESHRERDPDGSRGVDVTDGNEGNHSNTFIR